MIQLACILPAAAPWHHNQHRTEMAWILRVANSKGAQIQASGFRLQASGFRDGLIDWGGTGGTMISDVADMHTSHGMIYTFY
jgi:hypothetical protein